MSFWTGLEALSGHRPGAFTGMTMKKFFDNEMWDRLPRTWSGQRTPTGPTDIRMTRGGEPMMTNWYKGGGGQPTVPPAMALGRDRPFAIPRPDAGQTTPLQQQRIDTGKDIIGRQQLRQPPKNLYEDVRIAPNPYARQNPFAIGSPLPLMRSDQMGGGYFGRRDKSRMMFGEDKFAYNPLDMPELLGPADKVTKTVTSADPTKFDTSTTTITEKLLGPSGHRMDAFKDTAADVWKNIREDDIIQYWIDQFRG